MSVDENRDPPPQPGPRIIVAIDGTCGGGKSTIAANWRDISACSILKPAPCTVPSPSRHFVLDWALDESSGLEALAAETPSASNPAKKKTACCSTAKT